MTTETQDQPVAGYLERTFIGSGNCVIAAFDDRLPAIREQLDKEVNHG